MIIESHDDVVYLSGSLDTNQWPAVLAMAYLVYEQHPLGVIIDCSGLRYISPCGEQTFSDAARFIKQEGAAFVLAYLPGHVSRRIGDAYMLIDLDRQYEDRRIHQAIWSSAWWERLWGGAGSA